MRFVWLGFHAGGLPALEAVLEAGAPIAAILTLAPRLAAGRTTGADYQLVAGRFGIPLHWVSNINDPQAQRLLREIDPDIVFVVGWPQAVRAASLAIPRLGMIASHASLLPHNRGSAPINWALIRGERETGNTLFWLSAESNAGDIISQVAIPITPYDTSATLYERVSWSTRDMLLRLLPRLLAGERPGCPMPATSEKRLRRRRPADGRIDWSKPSRAVYDFIRALTRPYHGAFSYFDGRRWTIWQAALPVVAVKVHAVAGEVLGPVVSPAPEGCGQLVACSDGAVILLELEANDGTALRGPALSEQDWTGRRWGTHEPAIV